MHQLTILLYDSHAIMIKNKNSTPQELSDQHWIILGPVCVACGLIAGCIVFYFFKLTLFMTGVIGGAVFGRLLFQIFDNNRDQMNFVMPDWYNDNHNNYFLIAVMIIFGLIFGILTLKLIDSSLKILTPFIGSFLVTASIAHFIQPYINEPIFVSLTAFAGHLKQGNVDAFKADLKNEWTLISLSTWFILFLVGVFVQCRSKDKINDDTAHLYYYGQDRKETAMYRDQV